MHGSLHCSKKCQVLYCSHIVWTPSFLLKSTNIGTFIKGVLDAICSIFPRKHVYHCSSHIQVVKLSKTSIGHGGPCLFKGHSDTVACISMVHMCYVPKMNAGWNDVLPNIFANNVQRFSHSLVRELSNEFPKSLAFMVGVLFGFPKICQQVLVTYFLNS